MDRRAAPAYNARVLYAISDRLTDAERTILEAFAAHYVANARRFKASLTRM